MCWCVNTERGFMLTSAVNKTRAQKTTWPHNFKTKYYFVTQNPSPQVKGRLQNLEKEEYRGENKLKKLKWKPDTNLL